MHIAAKPLVRGDIVLRAGCRGVVWSASNDTVYLMPITANTGPFRRGDIIIDDLYDLAAIGAGVEVKIRTECQQRASSRGQTVIGRLSGNTIRRLERAVARSAENKRFEGRWTGVAAAERELRREHTNTVF